MEPQVILLPEVIKIKVRHFAVRGFSAVGQTVGNSCCYKENLIIVSNTEGHGAEYDKMFNAQRGKHTGGHYTRVIDR